MKLGIVAHLALVSIISISGCTNTEISNSDIKKPNVVSEKKIQPPFRFHKEIEVKPGLTFDVVSWGRGSETSGAYMILRSDSTHLKYRSITGELDGKLLDAWNMDMDSDGNPEIFIQAEGVGEGSHLTMYVYEFNDSGNSQKISFPSLSGSLKKGYKGQDSLFIKEGKLMREFPVFENEGTDSLKTTERRKLEYNFRSNSFSVKQIKEEDQSE
ncbi:MAG TPA: hypothetical protein VGD22_02010 [Sphingobacteriaceae bacterium]